MCRFSWRSPGAPSRAGRRTGLSGMPGHGLEMDQVLHGGQMSGLHDGIQPADAILGLKQSGVVLAETPFAPDQVQPASLDLRLGQRAYRVRASFLPGPNRTVYDRLGALSLHEIEL